MIKVMFIVLGELSSGELTIAHSFASRLPEDKFQTLFLSVDKHKKYLDDRGVSNIVLSEADGIYTNRMKIDRIIKDFNPDYFILSDVFTMEYAQGWTGLCYSSLKKEYSAKIIGLDEYEYLTAGYSIDYYGALLKKLPSLLEDCDYIIRNCPLNTKREYNPKIKDFRLFEESLETSEEQKAVVREELGVGPDEKLIFITSSFWETLNVYRVPTLSMVIKWLPKIMQNYITALNKKITVIHVGFNKWEEDKSGLISYKHFEYLSPEKFDAYLLSSDLYITTNIVSITLSKAVFGKIPCLVLQNHKLIDFQKLKEKVASMPEWYREMAADIKIAYPFRASVFGWDNFLKSVLDNNNYLNTFTQASIYKISDVMSKLELCLYDKEFHRSLSENQDEYIRHVATLPSPQDVMEDIVNEQDFKELQNAI